MRLSTQDSIRDSVLIPHLRATLAYTHLISSPSLGIPSSRLASCGGFSPSSASCHEWGSVPHRLSVKNSCRRNQVVGGTIPIFSAPSQLSTPSPAFYLALVPKMTGCLYLLFICISISAQVCPPPLLVPMWYKLISVPN